METIKFILEFKLLEINKYSISVYNLLIVILISFAVKGITYSLDNIIKKRLLKRKVVDHGRTNSVTQILKYIVYIIGFFAILNSLGINIDLLLGVFAALGLGIGFALQNVFKDFIAGIIILFEGNIVVGDLLEVDGLVGRVKDIKLRTSLIKTRDGIYMVIPNNLIVNEKVINWSADNKITRFHVVVGVAYGSDVEKVKSLLLECAKVHKKVANKPEPIIFFKDFADSALVFELQFWTLDTWSIESTKSELRFAIDKAFRTNNIQIPFPQRDVHLIQNK